MSNKQSATDNEMDSDVPVAVKRKKYLCQYRPTWTAEYPYLCSVSGNPLKAYCAVCRREFSVAHGGLSDVKQHAAGSEHNKNDRSATTSAAIETFLVKSFSVEHQKVLAAEMTSVYHAIKHNHS